MAGFTFLVLCALILPLCRVYRSRFKAHMIPYDTFGYGMTLRWRIVWSKVLSVLLFHHIGSFIRSKKNESSVSLIVASLDANVG